MSYSPTKCAVLGCSSEATTTFRSGVQNGELFTIELCAPHEAALRHGTEWTWNSDDQVVLVGRQLVDGGSYVLRAARPLRRSSFTSDPRGDFVEVALTVRHRGSARIEVFNLAIPVELARSLRDALDPGVDGPPQPAAGRTIVAQPQPHLSGGGDG